MGQHILHIHVIPGSGRFDILGWDHWRNALVIKLRNPPEGGKANKELVKTLSQITGCPVSITAGIKSRDKVVTFQCNDSQFQEIFRKLKSYEGG